MQNQSELFGLGDSSSSVPSQDTASSGWAIACPDGPLSNPKGQNHPGTFSTIPETSVSRENSHTAPEDLDRGGSERLVTFASQHALVAAARAGSHAGAVSRQLDLLPQVKDNNRAGIVSGELTWSRDPIQTTYKRLPPPSKTVMTPGQTIELATLPRELGDILAKYDTDNDGYLDEKEVMDAVKDMELMEDVVKSGRIPFSAFPARRQKMLRKHDTNNDEEIDVTEIIHGFEALNRERRRAKQLCWFTTGVTVFALILLVGMSGMLAYIRDLERDEDVSGTGKMFVKGSTTDVVQTASALYEVKDGVLVDRASSGQECLAGQQCVRPVSMAQASSEARLSSLMSDSDLQELKSLKIVNGDSWIFFKVRSVARYREPNSRFGTVVVVYTHLGEIHLDGDDIFFHERIAGAFADAGFRVVGSAGDRRRLLGLVETIGLFRSIVQSASFGSDVAGRLPLNGEFAVKVTMFKTGCDRPGVSDCRMDDGTLPAGGHMVNTSEGECPLGLGLSWVTQETQVLLNVSGALMGMTVVTSEQFPQQKLVTLQSETHKMVYQEFGDWNYYCRQNKSTELADSVEIGGITASADAGPPSAMIETPLGFDDDMCCGQCCKKYHLEPQLDYLGQPTGLPMNVWMLCDQDNNGTVYMIQYTNVVMRFDEISSDTSKFTSEALSMERAWLTCNNRDRNWPWRWVPGRNSAPKPPVRGMGLSREKLEDAVSPSVFISLTTAEMEAFLRQSFSNQRPCTGASCGRRTDSAYYCLTNESSTVGPEGFNVSYLSYEPCHQLGRRSGGGALVVKVDLAEAASSSAECGKSAWGQGKQCFKGSGTVTFIKEGNTIKTAGDLSLEIDILECFRDVFDYSATANIEYRTAVDPKYTPSLPLSLNIANSQRTFYESDQDCADDEEPKLGTLHSTLVLNATQEVFNAGNTIFQTSQQKELMSVSSSFKIESLLVSADTCGTKQTANTPMHIGYRLAFRWSGQFIFNLCRVPDCTGDCSPKWRVCGENEPPQHTPFSFDMYRQVFPASSSSFDNCELETCSSGPGSDSGSDSDSDSSYVYRYQCYQPPETGQGFQPQDCEGPIGFLPIPDTTCTPYSN